MDGIRADRLKLESFCTEVFIKLGVPEEEARDSAEILVAADARGIASHGVARLWRYVNGISLGIMSGGVKAEVLRETPMSLVLDARGAMGLSLSKKAMGICMEKAHEHGMGFCSVKNSNHFGIAGYYSEMAARGGMIGIAMTNTAALGVPTFAKDAAFGTNPIAFAVPGNEGRMFSLDMATTCVTRGKIETYAREGKPLPAGWAVDTKGRTAYDASALLADTLAQAGGGIMPLGGEGELFSGYKGYGLAVMVDVLTALLSGGKFGRDVVDSEETSARVCHFFGAARIDLFRDPEEFKADVDRMLLGLSGLDPAEGCERVYYAGQKEHESEAYCEKHGVFLPMKVADRLKEIGGRVGVSSGLLIMD